MNVAVIGLGKLGLPMAIAMAERGIRVFGIEKDPQRIRLIEKADSSIEEPGVRTRLKKFLRSRRLILTGPQEAVSRTEACFIAVNTPERAPGKMDTRDIESSVAEIAKALRGRTQFYVVSVASTIVPETTDRKIRPLLEKVSGRKIGQSLGIAANPVFIALGTVIRDYLNPPVVVVGATDDETSRWMTKFYERVCQNRPAIVVTSPLTAEIIKLAHNAYCTTKMAFINEVANLCSQTAGADLKKVEEFFAKGGERAGRFLKAGLGFGGPCFPRDLRLFLDYIKKKGTDSTLLRSIDESNRNRARELVNQILGKAGSLEKRKVTVLGLSYKPGVKNFEDSFSFRLIQELNQEKAEVTAYDPLLSASRNGVFKGDKKDKFILKKNLRESLRDAEICVLAHPSSHFVGLKESLRLKEHLLIFDPWK